MLIDKKDSSTISFDIDEYLYLDFKLREKLIDYIMTYQTSQNYTFEQLCEKSIDDLYKIKKEVG